MRLLVTGISGFVGRHVAAYLAAEHPQVEVIGLTRGSGAGLPCASVRADLEDPAALLAAVREVRPERVLHLAAQSSPARSWDLPGATLHTNVIGLLNLTTALREARLAPRLLVVGSGEEYGQSGAAGRALDEQAELQPLSPYAVSKLAQSFLALQQHLAHGLDVLRTRTFNHTGPGRGEHFAESSFARQIAEIEAGQRAPVLEVGNLEAVRDYSDVRDVVRAYWALFEHGVAGQVYNVCSGVGVRIGTLLERLLELSAARVEVRQDPARLRPADLPALVGDPARLRAATGFSARHTLEGSLRDLLDHWRRRVSAGTVTDVRQP
jgi:GDP-4-dehydro-6-deoxy-D-mannose reductase